MATHTLKTWPVPFEEVWEGRKTFELRQNDRGFKVGDMLALREYDPAEMTYSGRQVTVHVSYIAESAWGLPDGLAVMCWTHRYCIQGPPS